MSRKRILTPEPTALTAYTHILMARLCLDSGCPGDLALRHLNKTFESAAHPLPPWLQWRRAVCYRRAGAPSKALHALTCLERQEGRHHRLEHEKALCWMELKEWTKAIHSIDRAIDLQPDPFYLELRGDILVELGDIEGALLAFDHSCEGVDLVFARAYALQRSELYFRAIQEIDAGLEHYPTDGELMAQRGELKIHLGDLDGARWDFSVALALHKDASILARRAMLNVDLGRLEEAERDARQAMEIEPGEALTLQALALVSDARGKLQETAFFWGRYATLSGDPEGLLLQAEALNRDGKFQECDALLESYFRRFPDCRQGYYYRAGFLRTRGEFREAEFLLGKALYLHPQEHNLMVERVANYLEWGKLDKAQWASEQLLSRHEESLDGKKLQAEIYLAKRETSRALAAVDALMMTEPDDEIRLLRARSLVALRRHDEALEALDQFEDLGLVEPEYFEVRAYAHAQLGLWDEASADLRLGLEHHAEDAGLRFYSLLFALRQGEFSLTSKGARELLGEDIFYRYRLACRGIWLVSEVAQRTGRAVEHLRSRLLEVLK